MSAERIRKIIVIFISVLIPVALYALVQYFHLDPLEWPAGRSTSTIGHPVILAALLCLGIPFVLSFILEEGRKGGKLLWISAALILFFAVFSTYGRGPWIGLAVSIFTLVWLIYRGRLLAGRVIMASLLMVVTLVAAFFVLDTELSGKAMKRLASLTVTKTDVSVTSRIVYYGTALKMIGDHPVAGIGADNFRIVYPQYRPRDDNQILLPANTVPSMVHNGYLQFAAEGGLPFLVIYIFLVSTVLALLIKTFSAPGNRTRLLLSAAFMASFAGYLVQDLFGWSEIALTPLFWILAGLSVSLCTGDTARSEMQQGRQTALSAAALIIVAILGFLTYHAASVIRAERLLRDAELMNEGDDWALIEQNLQKITEKVPHNFYYQDRSGLIYLERVRRAADRSAYYRGAAIMENAHRNNPHDPYILIHRMSMDAFAMKSGIISRPTEFTEKAAEKVEALDRNNPAVYKAIAGLRTGEGKFREALGAIQKAIALREDPDSFLVQGNLLAMLNEPDSAMVSYNMALSLTGRDDSRSSTWKLIKHGMALVLLDAGELKEALKVIEQVLEVFPRGTDSLAIKGEILLAMRELQIAREVYENVLALEPGNSLARERLDQLRRFEKLAGPHEQ